MGPKSTELVDQNKIAIEKEKNNGDGDPFCPEELHLCPKGYDVFIHNEDCAQP